MSLALLPLAGCGGGGGSTAAPTAPTTPVTPDPDFTEDPTNVFTAIDDNDRTLDESSSTADLTVIGKGGDDTIITGSGNDLIRAGEGMDTISAGDGDDVIVVLGTTAADEYTSSAITNPGGSGVDLSSLLTLAELNGRSVSEVESGETIDGGAGNNTLYIYGTVDLTGVTLTNVTQLIVNSTVTLTQEQIAQFTTIDGDGNSVINIEVPAGSGEVVLDFSVLNISDIASLNISGDVTVRVDSLEDLSGIADLNIQDASQIKLELMAGDEPVAVSLQGIAEIFPQVNEIYLGDDAVLVLDAPELLSEIGVGIVAGHGGIDTQGQTAADDALAAITTDEGVVLNPVSLEPITYTDIEAEPIVFQIIESNMSDVIADPYSGGFYVSTTSGKIKSWDPNNGIYQEQYSIGGYLDGMALSLDGMALFVANHEYLMVEDAEFDRDDVYEISITRINLQTGQLKEITLNVNDAERGTSDISIDATGTGLFTTDYAGSGSNPFRQIDISTEEITLFAPWVSIQEGSYLETSEDNRYILIQEAHLSDGGLFLYDSQIGEIIGDTNLYEQGSSGFNAGRSSVSSTAGLASVITYNDAFVYDLELSRVFDLYDLEGVGRMADVQFSPAGDILYVLDVDNREILYVNTESWTVVDSYDVGGFYDDSMSFNSAKMSLSSDGRQIFLTLNTETFIVELDPHYSVVEVEGTLSYLIDRDDDHTFILDEDHAFVIVDEDVVLSGETSIRLTGNNVVLYNLGTVEGDVYLGPLDDTLIAQGGVFLGDIDTGGGDDTIVSGKGDNVIYAGAGDDNIRAGQGDDLIFGGEGSDHMDGGSGSDTVSYADATEGVQINLGLNAYGGGAFGDSLISIENIIGSDYDDIISGDDGDNLLNGGAGGDVVNGEGGNDIIVINNLDFFYISGGEGEDILRLDGIDLDLSQLEPDHNISEFQIIDLVTDDGENSLTLTLGDVLGMSADGDHLIVWGDASDSVTSTGQGWVQGDDQTIDGELYHSYSYGDATLLVDADITQTVT